MIYYRVAVQGNASSSWTWQSTILATLETLFRFLSSFGVFGLPTDRIRVFFASSPQALDEMLSHENNGLPSNSIPAHQLVNGSKTIRAGEMRQLESELKTTTSMGTAVPSLLREQPLDEKHTRSPFDERRMGFLDRRRLEIELGAGGDHDIPYTFTLPTSTPQVLAWMRLLARIRRGELQP